MLDMARAREAFEASDDFTVGIEEEFQLVDRSSGQLAARVEEVLPGALERLGRNEVSHELKRTMIETGTPVCSSLVEVRRELVRLRADLAAAVGRSGLAIVAAASHPASAVVDDVTAERDYEALAGR